METACVDGHSRLSLSAHTFTFMIKVKVCACVMCVLCAIYDNNISPSLLMIIIKIIILYFIQIRHTDAFPPTGTLLVLVMHACLSNWDRPAFQINLSIKGYAIRNDFVDDFAMMRALDAIFATLKSIVEDIVTCGIALRHL